MTKQRICLSMIVKDEAPVIERCLTSVLPIIDCWVICDTGSKDGTQDIIRGFFAKYQKEGELHQRPWRDFAYNRSEALELARSKGAYSLIIDADDTLEVAPDLRLPELTADSYMLDIQDSSIRYQRAQLVRNALPWRYRGVLHEFLTCDGAQSTGHLPVLMHRNHDGARRRDPNTYRKDAAILEAALQTEADPFMRSRYTFYLAQSYRDCGDKENALKRYLERADLGFWQEEAFYALYQAAKIKQELKFPDQDVVDAYLRAADFLQTRAEALHGASKFCRLKEKFEEGYQLAKRGLSIAFPKGGLFVEAWIYSYGLLDELAVNGYWSGNYRDSSMACERLLSEETLPIGERKRIEANLAFARAKLDESSNQPPGSTNVRPEDLERALQTEEDPVLKPRLIFQLAQSYQAAGHYEKALEQFLLRADLGGCMDETFVALYLAAQMQNRLGRPFEEVVATLVRASDTSASRAEALHAASRLCRETRRYSEGYEFARRGLARPMPSSGLLLEHWIYDYGLLDELAVNGYWAEEYEATLSACERLLKEGKVPLAMRERVANNAAFAADKITLKAILEPTQSASSLSPPDDQRSKQVARLYTKQFPIFRTIHIVWIGDEKRRPDECIRTWRDQNPDWSVRIWGNEELRAEQWRNINHIRRMITRELCGVADMMRWEILYKYGGFAVDADSVSVRPLEDWLFEPEVFACWENEIVRPGLIANGYVYSHPGNPLIAAVIEDIHRLQDVTTDLAWRLTGPQRLTDTVRNLGYTDITIYPSHYFMPEHYNGPTYGGTGPVFAKQFWGRARAHVYDDLANQKLTPT
jgi:mannosyltransferase OCH1-like enzyme/glycosyltransferase involved in cell wall biosynthesis